MNLPLFTSRSLRVMSIALAGAGAMLSPSALALADDAPAAPAPAAEPAPTPAPPAETPAPIEAPVHTPPKDLPAATDVINASIDAMGGKESLEKIKTARVKMLMVTPMGDLNMDMFSGKDGQYLVKQSMMGMGETTVGSDGKTGWMNNPMMGGYRLLEPAQSEQMQDQANIFSLVLNLSEQYPTIETVDRIQFAGEEAHKLRLVDKDANERFAMFSVKDKLMLGVELTEDGPMGEQKVALNIGEWKQFDDVKLFTKLAFEQMGMPMEMNFTEVELNKVEDAQFTLPPEVLELVKQQKSATPAVTPLPTEPAPAPDAQPPADPANP